MDQFFSLLLPRLTSAVEVFITNNEADILVYVIVRIKKESPDLLVPFRTAYAIDEAADYRARIVYQVTV